MTALTIQLVIADVMTANQTSTDPADYCRERLISATVVVSCNADTALY